MTYCSSFPWRGQPIHSEYKILPNHHCMLSPHTTIVLPLTVTESQNGGGWKGPLWVTQCNPLPKQGHPEQAAQDQVFTCSAVGVIRVSLLLTSPLTLWKRLRLSWPVLEKALKPPSRAAASVIRRAPVPLGRTVHQEGALCCYFP